MSEHKLGRDVFLALAAVGWSDGNLDAEEADAIVRTALESGLEVEEIAEIEKATKAPIDLGVIDRANLSKPDRLFVYAVASWMVLLDKVLDEREVEALRKLGDMLHLPDESRAHADEVVAKIARLPEGDRPLRYDLPLLRATLVAQL